MTLEKRYVRSQNELLTASEETERLRTELMAMQNYSDQVFLLFINRWFRLM